MRISGFLVLLFACISVTSCNNISKKAGNKIIQKVNKEITEEAIDQSVKQQAKHGLAKTLVPSHGDVIAIVRQYAKKHPLSERQYTRLCEDMASNPSLAEKIRVNADVNIPKWLSTRNHVNQRLITQINGRYPINARVYAGNTYYFDPDFNSKLAARCKLGNGSVQLKTEGTLTKAELLELDQLYPKGVPFSKQGFPDFRHVAYKDKNGKPMIVDIGSLTGDRNSDFDMAWKMFREMGYERPNGYVWHHIENSSKLILVPRKIHQLVDHTGSIAESRAI